MLTKIKLLLALLFISQLSFSQLRTKNWLLSRGGSVVFNCVDPTVASPNKMSLTYWSRFPGVLSDEKGNLLFYTDGDTVWGRNHQIMKNGIGLGMPEVLDYRGTSAVGHTSQTVSVVPKPGSKTQYYIFTLDNDLMSNNISGLFVSMVDMALDSGKGEVVFKDSLVYQTYYEGFATLSSTAHENGKDVWISIIDSIKSAEYGAGRQLVVLSFLVTEDSIYYHPVISEISPPPLNFHIQLPRWNHSHELVFAPNNRLAALSLYCNSDILLSFDPLTGKFSFLLTLPDFHSEGMAFSPNSKFLYRRYFTQFDIEKALSGKFDLTDCVTKLFTTNRDITPCFRPGPYGKLFAFLPCSIHDGNYYNFSGKALMFTIHQPNRAGVKCDFRLQNDFIDSLETNPPNFHHGYLYPKLHTNGYCISDSVRLSTFTFTGIPHADSVWWNFGDAGSKNNTGYGDIVQHLYSDTGLYQVKAITFVGKSRFQTTKWIYVTNNLGNLDVFCEDSAIICKGSSKTLLLPDTLFSKFLWNTRETSSSIDARNTGHYYVQLFKENSNTCFWQSDSIYLNFYKDDKIPNTMNLLGNDTTICRGDSFPVKITGTYDKFLWGSGDTNKIFWMNDTGKCVLKAFPIKDENCYIEDSFNVFWYDRVPKLGPDISACGTTRLGDFDNNGYNYKWNDGDNSPFKFADTSGLYILEMRSAKGCLGRDSIMVSISHDPPDLKISGQSIYCDSIPHNTFLKVIDSNFGETQFKWNTSSEVDSSIIISEGIYHVSGTNACGVDSATLMVKVLHPARAIISGQNIYCDSIQGILVIDTSSGEIENIRWSTGSSDFWTNVSKPGLHTVIVSNACFSDSSSIDIKLSHTIDSTFKFQDLVECNTNYVSVKSPFLIRDSFMTLKWLKDGIEFYNGSETKLDKSGNYEFRFSGLCGSYTDSFDVHFVQHPEIQIKEIYNLCDHDTLVIAVGNENNSEKYVWSTGATTNQIQVVDEGTYYVRISNPCGLVEDTFEVRKHYTTSLNIKDTFTCDVNEIIIDATIPGNYNQYFWSTGATNSKISITKSGKYELSISNPCQSRVYTLNVGMYSTPVTSLKPEIISCDSNINVKLTVGRSDNGEAYQWSSGETSPIFWAKKDGIYNVSITNPCGTILDSTRILISKPPEINIGKDTSLCLPFELYLNTGLESYEHMWFPNGERSHSIEVNNYGKYIVVVKNFHQCIAMDTIEIHKQCIPFLWIPTAFSPNNDGLNDVYLPVVNNDIHGYKMSIYNRWGEKVFESTNANNGWDGKYKNTESMAGVYLVMITYVNNDDKLISQNHYINLLR